MLCDKTYEYNQNIEIKRLHYYYNENNNENRGNIVSKKSLLKDRVNNQ